MRNPFRRRRPVQATKAGHLGPITRGNLTPQQIAARRKRRFLIGFSLAGLGALASTWWMTRSRGPGPRIGEVGPRHGPIEPGPPESRPSSRPDSRPREPTEGPSSRNGRALVEPERTVETRPRNGIRPESRPASRPFRPEREGRLFLSPEESLLGIKQEISDAFGIRVEDFNSIKYNFSKPEWTFSPNDPKGYNKFLSTPGTIIELSRTENGDEYTTYAMVTKNGQLTYTYPMIGGRYVRDSKGKTGESGDLADYMTVWGAHVKHAYAPGIELK